MKQLKSGHSFRGGAPFSPVNAAQWRMKPKKARPPGYKITQIFRVVGPMARPHYQIRLAPSSLKWKKNDLFVAKLSKLT